MQQVIIRQHSWKLAASFFILTMFIIIGEAYTDEWPFISDGLHGAVGTTDMRYDSYTVPKTDESKSWQTVAWQGERVSAHLVLWSKMATKQVRLSSSPLVSSGGGEIPAENIKPFFVSYVLADPTFRTCGFRPDTETPVFVEDALESPGYIDMEKNTVYPIWVTVDVPGDAGPGNYSGKVTVTYEGGSSFSFDITVEVLPLTLPVPEDWSFHLDLWQNPWSVARYHRVEPWSEEHWLLMKPILEMLDQAGQKCLTATIVNRPWNGQAYDPFSSMVKWTKHADGSWSFDYSLFDRWVRFGEQCGITEAINFYTMIPWGYIFQYYDGETGDLKSVTAEAGTDVYNDMWSAFLRDFTAHLKKNGWFEKTVIAMDERPVKDMLEVVKLVRSVSPGLKLALAGGDHRELYDEVHDYCFLIDHKLAPGLLKKRREQGSKTTYYVCCTPFRPNTFTISPLYESAYIGWYAYANDYDGFLRWAANSWVLDPLHDSSFNKWPSGDTFLISPGPRSTIRFERLREGIQDYEKLRIIETALEKRGSKGALLRKKLDSAFDRFTYPLGPGEDALKDLLEAKQLMIELSRSISK